MQKFVAVAVLVVAGFAFCVYSSRPQIQAAESEGNNLEKILVLMQQKIKALEAEARTLSSQVQILSSQNTDLAKNLEFVKKEAVFYGSDGRIQIKNHNLILGTHAAQDCIGSKIDVGPRDGNDNWVRFIRR